MHKHTLLTGVATLLFDMFGLLAANLVWKKEQRKTEHVTVELCMYKLEVLNTRLHCFFTTVCTFPGSAVFSFGPFMEISIHLVKLCSFEDKKQQQK